MNHAGVKVIHSDIPGRGRSSEAQREAAEIMGGVLAAKCPDPQQTRAADENRSLPFQCKLLFVLFGGSMRETNQKLG